MKGLVLSVRERPKREKDEGIAFVTINGQPIDASDPRAIDEAFKKIARQRDRLVASFAKHFREDD